MRKRGLWSYVRLTLLLAVLLISGNTNTVFAITSNSDNYQVTEMELGGSTSTESCSGQYCAKASIGDMATGKSESIGGTKATFGPVIDGEPLLEVIVEPGVSNLGILSADNTATKTTSVQVRNYLSGGYMVQITGTPPKYKDHTLKTPSAPTASIKGTEQFAINAVANTTPQVGANVGQFPDNLTSFGMVEDNYGAANMFMYRSGDVVARSVTESGQSTYTISMIVNISNETPAGHFSGDLSAVVIPVF
jgi:hypothetical protein